LLASIAGSLSAFGQSATTGGETNQPSSLKPVVVTGSVIPTAENITISPVEVLTAESIERTGAQDVMSALKKLTPDMVGSANISQTLNNGGFGESNANIRNLPTLVLLDGRRMAGSAFSAIFNAGSSVDLNLIPIAMVDSIEILKDGASALYGSDAIGGVINIKTKKNWNGVKIDGYFGFATQAGGYTEHRVSILGGTSNEKTSFTGGLQYYRADELEARDRYISSTPPADLAAMGIAPVQGYFSPSYNGRVGNYVLSGYEKFTGNPNGFKTPPVDKGVSYATIDAYNAAHPGVYVPIASTPIGQVVGPILAAGGNSPVAILNTTDFGSLSSQSQDRRLAMASLEHQLFEDRLRLFGDFLYANTRSVGGLAPSPMTGLGGNNIIVPGDNPYNPFQRTIGLGVADSPNVRSRFVDSGNRLFDSQTDYYRFTGGIKGDFDSGYSYEAAYNYNKSDQIQYTHNAINGVALNQALTPDPADPTGFTSMLRDANGNGVPTYNMFGVPGLNDPRTVNLLKTTLFNGGVSEEWGFDGLVRGSPFELKAGKVGLAFGGSYREESLSLFTDGLSQIGAVPGLNPALPFDGGKRSQYGVFGEVNIPIFTPEWNVPGFYNLELKAAGRIEHLEPGGDSGVPSVGFKWQPYDKQVTIRGTFSQGFLAPTLYNLYGPTRTSNPNITVQGLSGQHTVLLPSNPDLPPSTSDNYNIGIIYSPKQIEELTVGADYYKVDQKGLAYNPDGTSLTADLNARGSASPYASGFTFADGVSKLTTTAPNQITEANFGTLTVPTLQGAAQYTDGVDFWSNYRLKTETAGTFNFFAAANLTLSYDVQLGPDQPKVSYLGLYTDPQVAGGYQGLLPDWNLRTGVDWDINGFKYTVIARYVPEVTDPGDSFINSGASPFNDYTANGEAWKIPSYFTIDMRLAYQFGYNSTSSHWYSKMTAAVGVNNVTDEAPPFIPSSSEDNTDKITYDILGRFVYFELSKKF
jgi:iron complex outermembrane receptor protein